MTRLVYYNDNDRHAVAWLRELIETGYLPTGVVDDRSIVDVEPSDLEGFAQCHFFAGIGGWSLALALAGWSADRPVWTGSCPCQPFSVAGTRKGENDVRHLWPEFRRLIERGKPPVIFGEQVASKLGRSWLSAVRSDLETLGYAVGAADLCAAGVGAPHIRQRLYWVADTAGPRLDTWESGPRGAVRDEARGAEPERLRAAGVSLVHAVEPGLEGQPRHGDDRGQPGRICADTPGSIATAGYTRGFWGRADWLPCRDERYRPVEPGTFPLAHGVPARVGRLRGYGNAIVPPLAAAFIRSYVEARSQ